LIQTETDDLTTRFTLDSVTNGLNYKFKVSAVNVLGEGELSPEFVVFVSDMPEVMSPVTTSISGTKVVIDWAEPFDNYDPILSYDVQLLKKDGSLTEFPTECSGMSPQITHCEIEMAALIAGTSLKRGDLIRAQVRAVNSYPYTEPRNYADLRQLYSQYNSFGAVIETEPDALPTLDYDRLDSSNTRVVLLWTSLPTYQNGGSEVLGY